MTLVGIAKIFFLWQSAVGSGGRCALKKKKTCFKPMIVDADQFSSEATEGKAF